MRGVPLVELHSPHSSYISDSNGYVSIDPQADFALFGTESSVSVFSHGYELKTLQNPFNVAVGAGGYLEIELMP